MSIDTKRILMTLEERDKWIKRKEALMNKLKGLTRKERKLHKDEMDRIDQQIAYYDGLIREMKGEMRPGDAKSFLNTLMKF
jgi:hypothetical protein